VIRLSGICSRLTSEEIAKLSQIAHRRNYEPGQVILRSEDPPAFWAVATEGVVKLSKLLFDGRQQIVDLLFPGDFVGRPFSNSNPYFAEAVTQVELCCFRSADFDVMLRDNLAMNQYMLEHTLRKLDIAHEWMLLLGRKTAEERVASLLYYLVTRPNLMLDSDSTRSFILSLKREEMASALGLTYETVIRQIKALDSQGIISVGGRRDFLVLDMDALRRAAGSRP
jgi:CRP/FNR family transcriptional regulator, anaerobic regulatory protein